MALSAGVFMAEKDKEHHEQIEAGREGFGKGFVT